MTMKRILASLLVVLMVFTMIPATHVHAAATVVATAVVGGVVTDYADLQTAVDSADEGSTVTMTADIVLDAPLVVTTSVVLDMDGHKISNTSDIWNESAKTWSLISIQGGVLVIEGNGTLSAKENDCYAIDIRDGGACTIKNGTFVGNISAVYVLNGSAWIRGGYFSIQQKSDGETAVEQCRYLINCNDVNFVDGTAAVLITGGTFENFNPADNAAEGANTSFTNNEYEVDEDGNITIVCTHNYIVVSETPATCVEYGYIAMECEYCGNEKNTSPEPTGIHIMENGECVNCDYTENVFVCEHANYTTLFSEDATCNMEGFAMYQCNNCSETWYETFPVVECNYVDGVCSMCGATCTEHNYEIIKEDEATCTENGYVWEKCTVCGHEKNYETEATNMHVMENGVCIYCGYEENVFVCEHENNSVIIEEAATCTSEGFILYQCNDCKTTWADVLAVVDHNYVNCVCDMCGLTCTAHDYDVVKEEEATCTENGYVWMECTICGHQKNYETEATGIHVIENGVCIYCGYEPPVFTCNHEDSTVIDELAATCTMEGYILYQCNACMSTWVEYLSVVDHDYVHGVCSMCGDVCEHEYEIVNEKAPTCVEAGYVWTKCVHCGDEKNYEGEPATGIHIYSAVVTEPTCTEGGYTTYTCDCDATYVDDYTEAKGHGPYTIVIISTPTCTADAVLVITCACGHEVPASEWQTWENIMNWKAFGHNYTEATCTEASICTRCGDVAAQALGHHMEGSDNQAPPCTENGYKEHKCTRCEYTERYETEATGHSWVAPTCTKAGYCEYCGADGEAMLEHNWEHSVVLEPTCEAEGVNKMTCDDCGTTSHYPVAALGHVWSDPTCTECSRCGVCDAAGEDALGHDYEVVVTAPTCTEGGYTTYTCTRCGESYVADETEALGHAWEGSTSSDKAPTCTEDGFKGHKCELCGEEEFYDVPALGHEWADGVCTRCEAACEHNWDGSAHKEPTCTENGYKEHTCTICGMIDHYDVEANGHAYGEDGVCTVCGASNEDAPQTGDANTIMVSVLFAMMAAAGIGIIFTKKRFAE